VANLGRLKETTQILRDVPLDIAQAYSVSKYAAAALLGTSCGIPQTLELNLLEHYEEFVRSDVGDRTSSQGGKMSRSRIRVASLTVFGRQLTFRDARLQEFKPLACDDFEGMRARRTRFLCGRHWDRCPVRGARGIGVQQTGRGQIDAW